MVATYGQPALMDPQLPTLNPIRLPLSKIQLPADDVGPEPRPALVANIRLKGVVEPIIVQAINTPDGETPASTSYEVVEGRRRFKAAIKAGNIADILALVADPAQVNLDELRLSAHALRRENPQVELAAILRLVADGKDLRAISKATGMDLTQINKRMALRKLSPKLLELFESGQMALGPAEALAKLPSQVQAIVAERAEAGVKVTAAVVKDATFARTQAAAGELPMGQLSLPDDLVITDAMLNHPPRDDVARKLLAEVKAMVDHPHRNRTITVKALQELLKDAPIN